MPTMCLMSPGWVPSGNGGDYLTVFLVRNSQPTTLNNTATTEKVQLLDEASVLLRDHRVSSRIHDEFVKGKIKRVIGLDVALAGRLLHLNDKPVQALELICCYAFRKQLAGETEQGGADLVDFPDFLNRQAANE
jgi:hypothetical protein